MAAASATASKAPLACAINGERAAEMGSRHPENRQPGLGDEGRDAERRQDKRANSLQALTAISTLRSPQLFELALTLFGKKNANAAFAPWACRKPSGTIDTAILG